MTPKLFTIYFHELLWLATAICENCEAVFEDTAQPTEGHYIKVDPHLHARINAVLTDAANIKKLVVPSEKEAQKRE